MQNVARRNSDDAEALSVKHRISRGIAPRLIAETMTLSIHLDNETTFETGEVDRDLADRELTTKL